MDSDRPRILAVDDEPFMLELLARMLADIGLRVTGCSSARQAIAEIDSRGSAPDLILLDLIMPDMDGVELVRALAERRYQGSLILLSGEDEQTLESVVTLTRAHDIRMLGHVRKPVSRTALARLIANWVPPGSQEPRESLKAYSAVELREAIANGEFVNYYQPKVGMATGRPLGVECLVRWQHPSDGLVAPDRFIALVEDNGLVEGLTRAVLTKAIADAMRWQDAGLALKVAVNVSMKSLVALDFPDSLARMVASAGLSPGNVIIEVTESSYMANPAAVLDVLTRLRMKRFRLSIDDFGTGYSSLQSLTIVPFDELKIDRCFVHGAARNARRRAVVETSLRLAKKLRLTTVAEGVEDLDDWNFLRQRGCDLAQGYYVAKPMPAFAVPSWVETWSAPSIAVINPAR